MNKYFESLVHEGSYPVPRFTGSFSSCRIFSLCVSFLCVVGRTKGIEYASKGHYRHETLEKEPANRQQFIFLHVKRFVGMLGGLKYKNIYVFDAPRRFKIQLSSRKDLRRLKKNTLVHPRCPIMLISYPYTQPCRSLLF